MTKRQIEHLKRDGIKNRLAEIARSKIHNAQRLLLASTDDDFKYFDKRIKEVIALIDDVSQLHDEMNLGSGTKA